MAHFNELFLFRNADADESSRGERRGRFVHTRFVPVTDAQGAATAALELMNGGLDLIELSGGLGADTAAAVVEATGGKVPVGLADIRGHEPAGARAVISVAQDAGADLTQERYVHQDRAASMTIVAVRDPSESPAAAKLLVDEGVDHVTVCGGLGALSANAVLREVGDRARVDAVLFGFESLAGVAAYAERYARVVEAAT